MSDTKKIVPLGKSGFCAFPSEGSHEYCALREFTCDCKCHE